MNTAGSFLSNYIAYVYDQSLIARNAGNRLFLWHDEILREKGQMDMAFSLPQAPQWSSLIKSGCRVFVGGNASVPHALVQHLIDNSEGFSDIELVHMLALGDTR